jgi:hypothetical protein
MSGDYINIHVRSDNPLAVRQAVKALFGELDFAPIGDEAAALVVEDEDMLPDGVDWYGVLVSGETPGGWVSVYVEDWQDSGVLAHGLSRLLAAPVLEVWVAEETHWGYTYYEDGAVKDRFADDPSQVTETSAEAEELAGRPERLAAVLRVPTTEWERGLQEARSETGQFVGPGLDRLANAVGLPFEHLLIGYEAFFDDDPEDYGPSLEQWLEWRHLSFRHPEGREMLAE